MSLVRLIRLGPLRSYITVFWGKIRAIPRLVTRVKITEWLLFSQIFLENKVLLLLIFQNNV